MQAPEDQKIPQEDADHQNCCSAKRTSQERGLSVWQKEQLVLRATANHVQLCAMMLDALKKSSSIEGQILISIKSSPTSVHNLWKQRNGFIFNIHVHVLQKIIHNLTEQKNRPNLSNNCLLDEPELSDLP